jgi:hypothetical protein
LDKQRRLTERRAVLEVELANIARDLQAVDRDSIRHDALLL